MILKSCELETISIDSRFLRKGILLHLTDEKGNATTTEVSPLPGYSVETFEEAHAQLKQLKRKLLTTWWTKGALHFLSTLGLYPSVHSAVETALLDLLDPIPTGPCKRYALLFGSPTEIFDRAKEIANEGFLDVKIKLGHFSMDTAHEVISALGEQFRLRLDFNRKWDLEDTMQFCAHYPKDFFEYIEEPATIAHDLLHFTYPFAMDESLRDIEDLTPYLSTGHLKAFILKPTMTFPISPYLNLGPKAILTSSFESPIGIGQIERMIHRFGLTENLHGLDTLRYFDDTHEPLSPSPLEKASS
ncbi:MAG: enolase C-terminal domain-like protein [Simkaniaceae bacterium]|nr:enolase C-terminal domain-like protein [Candidatus Sacchlamyda saccharinae]